MKQAMEFLNTHLKWLIAFCKNNKTPIAIVLGFSMLCGAYLWSLLPSPYNPRYLFNLMTKTPTLVCRDGIYSWAATTQGACSGHGGVGRRY